MTSLVRLLFEFILFAVSLAALTYPVFFRPIDKLDQYFLPYAPKDLLQLIDQYLNNPYLKLTKLETLEINFFQNF